MQCVFGIRRLGSTGEFVGRRSYDVGGRLSWRPLPPVSVAARCPLCPLKGGALLHPLFAPKWAWADLHVWACACDESKRGTPQIPLASTASAVIFQIETEPKTATITLGGLPTSATATTIATAISAQPALISSDLHKDHSKCRRPDRSKRGRIPAKVLYRGVESWQRHNVPSEGKAKHLSARCKPRPPTGPHVQSTSPRAHGPTGRFPPPPPV